MSRRLIYLDVQPGILSIWPGRCAICRRVWWRKCLHPDAEKGPGHFKSVRHQFIPSWLRLLR